MTNSRFIHGAFSPPHPLGRHVNHDPRSRQYAYSGKRVVLESVNWQRYIPILDQGSLGSCTGNAMVGALGSGPVYTGLLSTDAPRVVLDQNEAVRIYSAATAIDPFPGTYPPTDTGSDGLSVCKVAKQSGYISGYTHCFSFDAFLQALMTGPVLIGMNWYSSFDYPAPSNGLVSIASNSYVRGGHEVLARGLDVENQLIELDNSWGDRWGAGGRFCMSFSTMERLLAEEGDATVPVPLYVPAPTPVPVRRSWWEVLLCRLFRKGC